MRSDISTAQPLFTVLHLPSSFLHYRAFAAICLITFVNCCIQFSIWPPIIQTKKETMRSSTSDLPGAMGALQRFWQTSKPHEAPFRNYVATSTTHEGAVRAAMTSTRTFGNSSRSRTVCLVTPGKTVQLMNRGVINCSLTSLVLQVAKKFEEPASMI
jgi:hypothetical protein